jgi:hypothetical protein
MRLQARLLPLDDATRERLSARVPGADVRSARHAVPLDHPALPGILAAGGSWVSGEAVFSAGELRSCTHFEAVCRAVLPESGTDQAANRARVEGTPLRDAGGFAPIRLVRGFVLSRIRAKPNSVSAIGDWTGEFAVGAASSQVLRDAACSGYVLEPIGDGRRGMHAAHHQLFGDAVLPPARIDVSVERVTSAFAEEDGRLRHLGCLTYRAADLSDRPDLTRTAEPWAGAWGWPSWVVGARVAALLRAAGVRGWGFRPVLVDGSPLHSEYLRAWDRLRALVAAAPGSRLDGGRW